VRSPLLSIFDYSSLTTINRFIVYPKPATARHDLPAFKVKSVLRETETAGKQISNILPVLDLESSIQ